MMDNIYNNHFIRENFEGVVAENASNNMRDTNELNKQSLGFPQGGILTVFFDSGNGFNESEKLEFKYSNSSTFIERVNIPINCVSIKIAPICGVFCVVNNFSALSNNGELEIRSVNSDFVDSKDKAYFFVMESPQIIIDIKSADVKWIDISCNIEIVTEEMQLSFINTLTEKIKTMEAEQKRLYAENEKQLYRCKLEQLQYSDNNQEYKYLNMVCREKNEAVLSSYTQQWCTEKKQLLNEIEELNNKYNYQIAANKRLSTELDTFKIHYNAAIDQKNSWEQQSNKFQAMYNEVVSSGFWRITKPFRFVLDVIKKILKSNRFTYLCCKGVKSLLKNGFKATWQKAKCALSSDYKMKQIASEHTISTKVRQEQENTQFERNIKFSILVPLYNTPIKFLDEMIASVVGQTYSNWELCLADGSDDKHDEVRKEVLKLSRKEPRIVYKKLERNMGISGNTNACIDMSTGDYIVLFDHDDVMHHSALYEVMKAICNENADYIYTDEATFESPDINKIITAHFKPDYAIDNLRANNYICHLSVFSREVLDKAGKFRSEYDGSQDHDMILRLTQAAAKVVHIPKVLYYWRSHPMSVAQDINSKTYAIKAGQNAVHDSILSYGYNSVVDSSRAFPTIYHIQYEISERDLVSIIIPNKNHYSDLKRCLDSIFALTTYCNYEIVIVDNGSDEDDILNYYQQLRVNPKVKLCKLDIPFNYSKLNNYATEYASGKYYILLNNDIEIITPEWIEEMLMYVQRDDVGAAGAMLYYPDDTIQHAGIILKLGSHRVAGHAFHKCPRNSIGYMGRLCYAQNMSAVTAACMMVKASVYNEVGGFDETFKVAYNDVDFCLKIRSAGYNIIWTPYAEAYHFESQSRGLEDTPEKQERFKDEVTRFKSKWKHILDAGDPYYNPNFSLDSSEFSLK